jgi:ArsR family transcriptional regulator
MKILTESGLVHGRRDGAWMRYCLNPEKITLVKEMWEFITIPHEACICKTVKEESKCDC